MYFFCPPVAQYRGKQSHYSHLSIEQEISYGDRKRCILFSLVECNSRYLKSHICLHFMHDIVINPIWLYCHTNVSLLSQIKVTEFATSQATSETIYA